MKDSISDRLAKAVVDLQETTSAVAHAQEQLRTTSVTVRSRDRSVEVTVNAQGHLSEVKFLDGKYRSMGAVQLSASLLEAAQQAQAEMAQLVLDAFQPLSERADGLPYVEGSGVDWGEIFGPLTETVERGAGARRGVSDKLRDEIADDPDKG
ncbi:YbaB/EbfC family nucleoid-associated protein (plasmid) [Streptomyces chartreusis]|uniref:YbaB/EbfC family nucleoid-associated protein n=1 Tax=Streptomyces chartreusis TaxID=1969 RepID=UPI003863887A|nr:YbaB/EbfC family nucleoid-associated protein [Streptomyces chartreusis]